MWKMGVALSLLVFPVCLPANANHHEQSPVSAQQCKTLSCVRSGIDIIDNQLVVLIGQRLDYVKRAGELKRKTASVHDQNRENNILDAIKKQTRQWDYPNSIAVETFKTLLAQSNIYEKRVKQHDD